MGASLRVKEGGYRQSEAPSTLLFYHPLFARPDRPQASTRAIKMIKTEPGAQESAHAKTSSLQSARQTSWLTEKISDTKTRQIFSELFSTISHPIEARNAEAKQDSTHLESPPQEREARNAKPRTRKAAPPPVRSPQAPNKGRSGKPHKTPRPPKHLHQQQPK